MFASPQPCQRALPADPITVAPARQGVEPARAIVEFERATPRGHLYGKITVLDGKPGHAAKVNLKAEWRGPSMARITKSL